MMTKSSALILGGHYAALSIARSLGNRGITVYCHDQNPNAVTLRSRHVKRFCPGTSRSELLEEIKALSDRAGEKPILYITADTFLTFISENGRELRSYVRYPYLDDELINILVDKSKSERIFEKSELRIPKTWLIDGEISTAPKHLPTQTVIKPLLQTDWTQNSEAMQITNDRKVLRFDNPALAQSTIHKMRPFGAMAVQEFVPGDDKNLYYYVGYRAADGQILASFTGRKLRTLQEGMGSETLLSSEGADDVAQLGMSVLKKLNIIGPAGIDIKRNAETGELFVIEVNHRFGLSDGILTSAGIDLPMIYYRDMCGEQIEPVIRHRTDINWVWLEPELRLNSQSFLKLIKCMASLLTLALRGRLCVNEFAISDPLPGLGPIFDRLMERVGKGLRHA